MSTDSGRVFVIDDDRSVRAGFARLLASAGYAVETFSSSLEFLERALPTGPCCLVLDVQMPGPSGIELQATLAAMGRPVSIVFVTGHVDVPMSVAVMKAGAVDLLTKPVDEKDLLDAVARAIARDAREKTEDAQIGELQESVARLTPREREVFACVVTGMLNKQIAFELGVVEKTIKVHRARVMQKMGAKSLAELVRMADRVGVSALRPGEGERART